MHNLKQPQKRNPKMPDFKHVGRVKTNRRKVVVAYRVVPGDPENCLVVQTENLSADEHDTLLKLVESDAAQNAYELGEAMSRTMLPDGRNMLAGFHTTGKLNKVPADMIEMTPNNATTINLKELNELIATQQGVTVADLALKGADGKTVEPNATTTDQPVDPVEIYSKPVAEVEPVDNNDGVLSDEALAKKFRSDADRLSKEAAELRRQAEELVPTKKKTTKKASSETA